MSESLFSAEPSFQSIGAAGAALRTAPQGASSHASEAQDAAELRDKCTLLHGPCVLDVTVENINDYACGSWVLVERSSSSHAFAVHIALCVKICSAMSVVPSVCEGTGRFASRVGLLAGVEIAQVMRIAKLCVHSCDAVRTGPGHAPEDGLAIDTT
eukprot:672208-Pleurochrysis_carterae.AAC.1